MNSHHPIWSVAPQDVYNSLTTTPQGLSDTEADLRIKQYGYNELPPSQTRPLLLRFYYGSQERWLLFHRPLNLAGQSGQ